MKKKHNLVIIFGAGATRGAFQKQMTPPPIDKDFFDIAGQVAGHGTPRLAKQVIKDVFDLYGRVSGVGLEQYFRDIETRAEISSFAKSKNKPKDWKKRQRNLEELVRRVLLHTTCDFTQQPAAGKKSAVHQAILSYCKTRDTLITFNYDTVIEESIPNKVKWNPKNGYGTQASGITGNWATGWLVEHQCDSNIQNQVHLLKLHGSLNWTLYKTNKVRLKPRPYVVRSNRGNPVFDKCSILPPGWHKRISVNPYCQLWQEARLKIESCSALAIIGYSLPETDLLARAFFAEVSRLRAKRKEFLSHLYIADPDESVKDRFVNLFAPALGPKGHIYRYKSISDLNRAWKKSRPKR